MPDISTALALLRKPIDAAGEAANGKAKEAFAKLKASSALKALYQKLNSTQKVKSIWNVDRAIAISSFYYPAKIKTTHGFTQQLTNLDELPSNHVVLSGIVGQGKSILLKYLLGKEIRSGTRFPLFVELRRVPASGLEQYINKTFFDLVEIWNESELFHLFAKEGKISILLDGFDEVDPGRALEFSSSIESLALRYPTIRIVVTSRPGSGIENSPLFDVIPLTPLQSFDLPSFFQKILSKDRQLADRLTAAVRGSQAVTALASTPLLATLLTIVYRAHQRIPTDFPEFYEELFQILLVRHDRSKAGYERKRKTKAGDREIQQIFEAFCYKSKADGTSSLTTQRAGELAAESVNALQLSCDSEAFLDDIIKVTCLLQEEGGRIEFLHQSVQEFFAARYIASRPDHVARRFYELAQQEGKWFQWDQVLRFLGQIDKYRASKYFFIPCLETTLRRFESLSAIQTRDRLCDLVASRSGVKQAFTDSGAEGAQEFKYFIHHLDSSPYFRVDYVDSLLFSRFFKDPDPIGKQWQKCFDGKTNGQFMSYCSIAEVCGNKAKLGAALEEIVTSLRKELSEHMERVSRMNASVEFMGL